MNLFREWAFRIGKYTAYLFAGIGFMLAALYVYKRETGNYFVFNFTPSISKGIYLVTPGAKPHNDSYVVFRIEPTDWMILNGMDFGSNLYIKIVGASNGDKVLVKGNDVIRCITDTCDQNRILGTRLVKYVEKLNIPDLELPAVVPENHYLVFGTSIEALDSRYFGFIDGKNIYGTAKPILTYN